MGRFSPNLQNFVVYFRPAPGEGRNARLTAKSCSPDVKLELSDAWMCHRSIHQIDRIESVHCQQYGNSGTAITRQTSDAKVNGFEAAVMCLGHR